MDSSSTVGRRRHATFRHQDRILLCLAVYSSLLPWTQRSPQYVCSPLNPFNHYTLRFHSPPPPKNNEHHKGWVADLWCRHGSTPGTLFRWCVPLHTLCVVGLVVRRQDTSCGTRSVTVNCFLDSCNTQGIQDKSARERVDECTLIITITPRHPLYF